MLVGEGVTVTVGVVCAAVTLKVTAFEVPPPGAGFVTVTADLDDGLDSGILSLEEVREAVPPFRAFHDAALRSYPSAAPRLASYEALRRLLNLLVTDLMEEVRARVTA